MVIYKFLSTMNVEVQYNRIRFQFKFLYVYLFFFTFFWGAPQWSFWQLCCVFETLLSSNILTCNPFMCLEKKIILLVLEYFLPYLVIYTL